MGEAKDNLRVAQRYHGEEGMIGRLKTTLELAESTQLVRTKALISLRKLVQVLSTASVISSISKYVHQVPTSPIPSIPPLSPTRRLKLVCLAWVGATGSWHHRRPFPIQTGARASGQQFTAAATSESQWGGPSLNLPRHPLLGAVLSGVCTAGSAAMAPQRRPK